MGKKIAKYIPALASFAMGGGLEVSGIEIPWLGYSLMILAGLLLVIPAWPYLKRIHFQKPIKYGDSREISSEFRIISQYEYESFDSYKSLLAYDKYHLGDSLVVQNESLSYYAFNTVGGGQLQFTFDVFNGSLLEVTVGEKVEGDLVTNYRTYHDKIEPLESAIIPHSNWGTIIIKQRILPQVCEEIISKAKDDPDGIVLSFDFKKVKIHITERNPVSISISPSQYLKLPEKLTYKIKMRELKMGDSTFGDYEVTLIPDTKDS